MIDPRVVLLVLALLGGWWVSQETWRGLKWTGCHVAAVFTAKKCGPVAPMPPVPNIDIETP